MSSYRTPDEQPSAQEPESSRLEAVVPVSETIVTTTSRVMGTRLWRSDTRLLLHDDRTPPGAVTWVGGECGVVAHATSYRWPGDSGSLSLLVEASQGVSDRLRELAVQLPRVVADAEYGVDYFCEVVVLDHVEVAPELRRQGFGSGVAAESLYVAGAHSIDVLVAALANVYADDVVDRIQAEQATFPFAKRLGLDVKATPIGGVFVGHTSYVRPGSVIDGIVHNNVTPGWERIAGV